MNTEAAAGEVATPPPVRKDLTVVLPLAEAFALFTEGITRWWPMATHSCFQAQAVRVAVEPRRGGDVIEHASDGRQSSWGKILEWEPPYRFAMTWHPAADPAQATHVEVTFADAGSGQTTVTLVHTGWQAWGDKANDVRNGYNEGWVGVLDDYLRFSAQRPAAGA